MWVLIFRKLDKILGVRGYLENLFLLLPHKTKTNTMRLTLCNMPAHKSTRIRAVGSVRVEKVVF